MTLNLILMIVTATITITSPVFENKGLIPVKYTCQGVDVNPPLNINAVPMDAKSLVLILDDPDAPKGTYDHWVVWNIPATTKMIPENSTPGIAGKNSEGKNRYKGPCPPSETHRYFFKIYALDTMLELEQDANKTEAEDAMDGHILATGELVGLYKKQE